MTGLVIYGCVSDIILLLVVLEVLPRWLLGEVFPPELVGELLSTFQAETRFVHGSASEDAARALEPLPTLTLSSSIPSTIIRI